jgi:hypothetical protein
MQLIYTLPVLIVAVIVGLVATPIIGIVVFVVLAAITLVATGALGSTFTRTSTPEPTGRPRASRSGVTTSNQRQGQD